MTLTTRDESSRAGAELDVHSDPSDICHREARGLFFYPAMEVKNEIVRYVFPFLIEVARWR